MHTPRSSSRVQGMECVCLSACWDPPWAWAWRSPQVWAWRPPWPDAPTSPLGVGLETPLARPPNLLSAPGDPLARPPNLPSAPGHPLGQTPQPPPWVWAWRPPQPDPQPPPWVWAWRPPGQTPPVNRILDRRFWKYYLAPTSLRVVIIWIASYHFERDYTR